MVPSSAVATEPTARDIRDSEVRVFRRWERVALIIACGELVVLAAPTVRWLFERWTISVWHNAHGMFIPPIVGYLAYRELQRRPYVARSSSAWGYAFLVPALVLHALDAGMHTQLLSAVALLLMLPGLALLLLGVERTRAIAFPLLFLVFALPIPLGFTEQIHWQLRVMVTAVTATIVPWLGIPVFAEGTTLQVAKGTLQVADACSGFSTLYAAAAVACLTAYSASSTRRRVLVLLSAAPLAIAANLLRVVMLVVLVAWLGNDILATFIHPASGMMTFALALPVIFWLGGDTRQRESS
jgi:exosortase